MRNNLQLQTNEEAFNEPVEVVTAHTTLEEDLEFPPEKERLITALNYLRDNYDCESKITRTTYRYAKFFLNTYPWFNCKAPNVITLGGEGTLVMQWSVDGGELTLIIDELILDLSFIKNNFEVENYLENKFVPNAYFPEAIREYLPTI